MANKLALLSQLMSSAMRNKSYVIGLIGNIAGTVADALDEVSNNLQTQIDGIEIGGRNLAESTANHKLSYYGVYKAGTFTFLRGTDSSVPSGTYDAFTWSDAPTDNGGGPYVSGTLTGAGYANYIPKMINGETITVSLWMKCSSEKTVNKVHCEFLNNEVAVQKGNLTTSWQKVILRGQYNGRVTTGAAITFYNGTAIEAGDTLYISSLKVEKGTKATDWTPAPEDINAQIDTLTPKSTAVNIPTSGWGSDSTAGYPKYYDIAVSGISANDRAAVTIAQGSLAAAKACGMCQTNETFAGKIRIRAAKVPTAAITAQYWVEKGKG